HYEQVGVAGAGRGSRGVLHRRGAVARAGIRRAPQRTHADPQGLRGTELEGAPNVGGCNEGRGDRRGRVVKPPIPAGEDGPSLTPSRLHGRGETWEVLVGGGGFSGRSRLGEYGANGNRLRVGSGVGSGSL